MNGNIRKPQMIVSYNFIERVTHEEDEILLAFELDLFSIGIFTQPNQMVKRPQIQFKHELGTVVVDETVALEKIKNLWIAKWNLF